MQTNLSIQITQYLDALPPKMQEEVLAFIEYLMFRQQQKKNEKEGKAEQRNLNLIGTGDSKGAINAILNLRDFAHD